MTSRSQLLFKNLTLVLKYWYCAKAIHKYNACPIIAKISLPHATYRRKTATQRPPGLPTETVVTNRLPSLYPFVVVDDLGLDWANLLQPQH
jgi:hypothetical protein